MKSTSLALLISLCCVGPALAGGPITALVEDVTGPSAGVEFMDYLEAGKVIHLDPEDSIVVSYLYSCTRETIHGGTITVGRERSDVELGKVERMSIPCDAGRMLLTSQIASQSAGSLIRGFAARERERPPPPASPQFTLYGLSPMLDLKGGGGTLEITRLDKTGEHYALTIGSPQSIGTTLYDLASTGTTLSPGGIYRATLGAQSVTFKIDPSAKPGKTPILGRLLRLDRAL
jgi:hypothetical protein